MSQQTTQENIDSELSMLENQVSRLVDLCTELKEENKKLRMQFEQAKEQNSQLMAKNELVTARVSNMVERLKSLEGVG